MKEGIALAILFAAILFGLVALGGAVTMVLWNWVVPALGGPKLGFWTAAGVNLLAAWLFGRSGSTKLK